jgi:hypothetical protein
VCDLLSELNIAYVRAGISLYDEVMLYKPLSRRINTACFKILSGISEVCSSETNSPTVDESGSVKRVYNRVFFLCLVPGLVTRFPLGGSIVGT